MHIKKFTLLLYLIVKANLTMEGPQPKLYFTKIDLSAFPPSKHLEKSPGYILKSAYDAHILPNSFTYLQTGLQLELPKGCYGRIAPLSYFHLRRDLDIIPDEIDENFRCPITIKMYNGREQCAFIKRGDAIAQIICERVFYPELEERDLIAANEKQFELINKKDEKFV
jgi:dUTP pyrophosphatase